MAVKIIQKDERLVYNAGDTTFYYKRISSERASAIRRKHTKRGDMDAGAAGFEMLRTHLLGWENVQDWDDNQVEFTSENIALIPDEILADLITMISSSDGTLAITVEDAVKSPGKAEKNS
jgi:hypothetical protein